MGEVSIIGLDLAKNVFQAHGAGVSRVPPQVVAGAAVEVHGGPVAWHGGDGTCASSHHWARAIGYLGHDVRLIPPAYVKPFVRRQKNEMADAEAIALLRTRASRERTSHAPENCCDKRAHDQRQP
jgi:transposase